jgi:hypothetical protein
MNKILSFSKFFWSILHFLVCKLHVRFKSSCNSKILDLFLIVLRKHGYFWLVYNLELSTSELSTPSSPPVIPSSIFKCHSHFTHSPKYVLQISIFSIDWLFRQVNHMRTVYSFTSCLKCSSEHLIIRQSKVKFFGTMISMQNYSRMLLLLVLLHNDTSTGTLHLICIWRSRQH